MRRSSSVPWLLSLPRRIRPVAVCLAILVLIGISLFSNQSSPTPRPITDDTFTNERLSKYLSIVSPETRDRLQRLQTQTRARERERLQSVAEFIDNIPEIPPTLLEDDDPVPNPDLSSALPSHSFETNGLLIVNPDASHPIYELVRHAEAEWGEKLRKSSKTLEQAVKEYTRRYGRLPPKGFDKWWEYVQTYNVQLPDEYDQIHRDFEPYWGIDPRDLQAAQAEQESKYDRFTIGKISDEDIVSLVNMSVDDSRAHKLDGYMSWGVKPQIEMLNEVYQYIPPFRATLNPSDNPTELVDWAWRDAAIQAAKKGTFLKPEDLPPQERSGWSGACPPDSPLYLNPPERDDEPTPQTSKTFIYDHRASMDPCYHPQHILRHGNYLSHGVGTKPERFPAPLLSNCATPLHGDIRATSMAQSSAYAEDDPRWDDKDDDRLFWRGSPTGMRHHSRANWRSSQRVRLVNLTRADQAGQIFEWDSESFISFLDPTVGPKQAVGEPNRHARRRVNRALMDISFSGPVSGCEPGLVCEIMKTELPWAARVSSDARGSGRYKFVLDVDGNGWSSRFRRLMSSHALVFKSTLYPEWWTDRAQAWVHYIPVQLDYSDLYDSVVFFGGDLGGDGAHEEMARKIASAGREWVERFWRKEDVIAYMFRLWLEYARVMSLDRDDMSFHLPLQD